MKASMICGLMALQLAAGITATAQNYYVKISGDRFTRVADHAHWHQGAGPWNESMELYNLDLGDGKNAIGTMRFQSAGNTMSYATHYRLNSSVEQVVARKIVLPATNSNSLFVVAEKIKSGVVKSAAVFYYNSVTGSLDKSWELAALPTGYELLHVFDVIMEPNAVDDLRILCTVKDRDKQGIMELLFNITTGQYKVKQYKPATLALDQCNSVYYLRANHYGRQLLDDRISFYGMGISHGKSVAFCYSDNKYEQYNLFSELRIDEIAGVQMIGSYGATGLQHRIDMAFIDAEGDICIQQKDDMARANWRRFYRLPNAKLSMGTGRDGHGTKNGSGMQYFIATAVLANSSNHDGQVTTLHYNALNGDMNKPNLWNFSGVGVNEGGGFPNDAEDPDGEYTFIADRFNQKNGFKFGTGNTALADVMPCTELHDLKEYEYVLKESRDELNITTYDIYTARALEMIEARDIRVEVIPECDVEQRNGTPENASILLPGVSTLQMNAAQLRLETPGKIMVSLQLLSVDGRTISEVRNINSNRFEQQFARTLVPGIYLVHIGYADHSTEVRKVSIR